MAALPPPAQNDGKTYYRLAWVTDVKNPHLFGKRFGSRRAAQQAAPAINRERATNGKVRANYVLELKFRTSLWWPRGRYIPGERFALPRTRIPKTPPVPSSSTR
jgi:hypothetical protein